MVTCPGRRDHGTTVTPRATIRPETGESHVEVGTSEPVPVALMATLTLALALSAGMGSVSAAAPIAQAASRVSFTNPVSTPDAPSFPDPSVIHGKDGFWYAFATSDPVSAGGPFPQIPILRSRDPVHWTRIGEVFPGARPAWITDTAGLWAPDIRFLDGHYVLYYVATDTVAIQGARRSVRRPGRGLAGHVPGRRDPGHRAVRQPLDRYRAQPCSRGRARCHVAGTAR